MADQHDKQNQSRQDDGPDATKRRPVDQPGHTGLGGHGGQQSGGMGGMHGGDLHDIGSGGSGMTGGGGMGGNEAGARQGGHGSHEGASQKAEPGERQAGDDASYDEFSEVQQSIQREGMGHHRRSA